MRNLLIATTIALGLLGCNGQGGDLARKIRQVTCRGACAICRGCDSLPESAMDQELSCEPVPTSGGDAPE